MSLRPTEYFRSDDFDFCCGACGRNVKRAVALSDGMVRGMDCAAVAMGRPKGTGSYHEIEMAARKQAAENAAAAFSALSPKPSRQAANYQEYMATVRAVCPFPEHSVEWHAFFGAL